VGELRRHEAAADDEQSTGDLVDPHDRVAAVHPGTTQAFECGVGVRGPGAPAEAGDVRQYDAAPGGDDDLLRGDALPGPGVDGVRTGEPGVPLVERDIRVALGAPSPAGVGDRVDTPEDPVPDLGPVDLVQRGVHTEGSGAARPVGQVGWVDEHLRRDAADVEARAAEGTILEQCDALVGEAGVDDGVPGSTADDREVVVRHGSILPCCGPADRRLDLTKVRKVASKRGQPPAETSGLAR